MKPITIIIPKKLYWILDFISNLNMAKTERVKPQPGHGILNK